MFKNAMLFNFWYIQWNHILRRVRLVGYNHDACRIRHGQFFFNNIHPLSPIQFHGLNLIAQHTIQASPFDVQINEKHASIMQTIISQCSYFFYHPYLILKTCMPAPLFLIDEVSSQQPLFHWAIVLYKHCHRQHLCNI